MTESVIFNMASFVRRNLGDRELSRDVALLFIQHSPEYLREIRAAVSGRDSDALCQAAHKLRGAAANLDLLMLRDSVTSIEAAAKRGDIELASSLLLEMHRAHDHAVHALEEEFGTAGAEHLTDGN